MKIHLKFNILSLSLLISLSSVFAQQQASILWELKADTLVTSISGNIMGFGERFSNSTTDSTLNLQVKDYQGGVGQRLNLGNIKWQKETVENPGRFIAFALKPYSGYNFIVTSVSLDIGGGGTSTMNANIYYASDSSFSTRVKLNSESSLPNGTWLDPSPSYTLNESIPYGNTFYLLVFPWYNSTNASTGKYIYLRNIKIQGYTVATAGSVLSVLTSDLTSLSFNSVKAGGNVLSDGGNQVTARGVCWNTTGNPTIADSTTSDGSGIGSFSSEVSGLGPSTKYYLRAYATNSEGTAYGAEIEFTTLDQPLLAFPGAEGYGRYTTGGRGGKVFEVTSLEDSNSPGTLRYAINQNMTRTIVFRISGTIFLKSSLQIKYGNLTIAGQTAPGDGICIAGYTPSVDADNVIVRYLRFRLGDVNNVEDDAFNGRDHKDIIIDHCSMTWSVDEAASFYDNRNFTMQWCIIGESLYNSSHPKGAHGYGGIQGGMGATFHHNLYINNSSRNPRFCGARYHISTADEEIVDFVNNVVYNWGFNSVYGGEIGQQNVRANYYKPGAATKSNVRNRIVNPTVDSGTGTGYGKFYVADNYVEGYPSTTSDNWSTGVQGPNLDTKLQLKVDSPFPIAEVNTETAEDAYQSVLKHVGPNFPKLDSVDTRLIEEAKTGISTFEGLTYKQNNNVPDPSKITGIIDSQTDVGGWPVLNSSPAPTDFDHDGIPDSWENSHGLNPADVNDGAAITATGYSNLELYLEDLLEGNVSAVNNENEIPVEFQLNQNFPNPFNPETSVSYSIPKAGNISVSIYNIQGMVIKHLVSEEKAAGTYNLRWNGRNDSGANVSSGVYFFVINYSGHVKSIKMMLLK